MIRRHLAAFVAVLLCLVAPTAHAIPVVPADYTLSLYATGIGAVTGLSFAPDGSLIAADYAGGRILQVGIDGSLQTLATGLQYIENVAYSSDGSLFAVTSTSGNSAVYQIASDGTATLYASGFSYPTSMDVWNDELYLSNSGSGTISKIDAQGNVTTVLTTPSVPNGPFGISFDAPARCTTSTTAPAMSTPTTSPPRRRSSAT
jgi:DNA-binding beta-propeller fold protein YncE